jgi:hypothetical protein
VGINIRSLWPTVLAIAVLYGFALRTGSAFVFYGLACADTCWLVALGAITTLTGAIPKTDPFSFTLPMLAQQGDPQPYIVYQWLAELVFYYAISTLGMPALLMMASVVAIFAYVALPFRYCIKANASPLWSILAVSAACATGNMRSNLRPEIFSAFFIALWLSIMLPNKRAPSDESNRVSWIKVLSLTAIMIFWVNLHSGFVYGLILLLIYSVASVIADKLKGSLSGTTKTLGLALLTSTLATLVNPYGVGLWLYLPRIFLTPLTPLDIQIIETLPLPAIFNKTIFVVPIICVLIICLGAISWNLFRRYKSKDKPTINDWTNLIVIVLAAASCLFVNRLASLSSIIITMATASLISKEGEQAWPQKFWGNAISYLLFEIALAVFATQGVLAIANKFVNLSLPQATADFKPPFEELNAFAKMHNGGNVLASYSIADMIDLYYGAHQCLFMDSRMDIYPAKIFRDYVLMMQASKDAGKLLDQYKIEWVFLSPKENLGAALQHNPQWTPIIQNDKTLLFRRTQPLPK